jgi:methyl-accepting chemotaxis protein
MNHFLRKFTIHTRMLGAIGMVLALLGLVGGAGLWSLQSLSANSEQFISGTHASVEHLGELRGAFGDMRRFEKDLMLSATDPTLVTSYRARWAAAGELVRSNSRALIEGASGEAGASAKRIQPLLAAYTDKAAVAFSQLTGTADGAVAAIDGLEQTKIPVRAAEAELAVLAKALQADKAAYLAQAGQTRNLNYSLFGVAVLLAVLLVVPLTLMNMRSICGPIDQARALAERIANGDLSTPVITTGSDETAALLRALEAMQTSLHGIVGQVRQSADSIQVASAEVAAGNIDLSQRTEQAASNLQQTASSMTQLTGNVRQSADAASQANQLAASASVVARRGGAVVAQVVSTMDEINGSSKRIADIIGTIDGIAFQTNILALNAAVEAARAGEQGRGFAVVAAEVRSLAQRSAEAAREIKTLIGSSVEKVETGARLVQDAGATMNEIVASVQRVTDIIGEITAAAAEQSSGIGTVNGAVTQLDQMTQQNAALVEESAAAAESLKGQAQRLADVVGRFQLGSSAQPAVYTTPARAARPAPRPAAATPRPYARASAAAPRHQPAAAPIALASVASVTTVPSVALASSGESSDWESF